MQRGSAADPLTGPVNADNATQSHFQGDRVARRVWLNVHRWFGLKLSILMSFILITGTLATVSHEIDWLIDDTRRVWPPVQTDSIDWQGVYDAVRAAYPDWAPERLHAPQDPWFAAEVWAHTETGALRRIWVHPESLAVQGDTGWFNAQRLFRDAHRRLMIFTWWGVALVSAFSILLLGSIITGLVVYRRFWRGFFRKPRTRDARTLWGDLHRLGGLWGLWFAALMAITALWYLVEALGGRAPVLAVRPITAEAPMPADTSLTALAARAGAALNGFAVNTVVLPHFAGDPVRFQGQTDAILVRDRANEVRIRPEDGAVVGLLQASDLGAHQRIAEMADPLHFGTFAGLPGKLVYFVFGIILSGMSLSGVYIYSRRIRNAAAKGAHGLQVMALAEAAE